MSNVTDVGIQSEQRSGHWVSWLTHGGTSEAVGAVLLVGQTREEAEGNARRWAERVVQDTRLPWR